MPRTAAEILKDGLKLSLAERQWVAENLLAEQGSTFDAEFDAWQKEVGEPEPGYDEWFRAGVEEALRDKSPGIPHEQVMHEIAEILTSAREKQRLKESA